MPRYYEFEVTLQEIQPRIWRRFRIRATSTFAQLHQAIQDGFGWKDYHLWEFRLPTHEGRLIAGLPDQGEYEPPAPDARHVKLNSYFTGRRVVEWCEYLYDFGDSWVHEVKLIAVRSLTANFKRRLLDGERSAPPEDCGGTDGYGRLVRFLDTGVDELDDDPEGLTMWLGGWRPGGFDLKRVQAEFDR